MAQDIEVKKIDRYVWEVPKTGEMLVPGRIYTDEAGMEHLLDDIRAGKDWNALKQIVNVACLPGIQVASLAMADVHPGYGFCIGGVGAFDMDEGVISVAGVGFDVNCGVRTLRTGLTKPYVDAKKEELAHELYRAVPAGVGSKGKIRLTMQEIDQVLTKGARFAIERGYGIEEDLEYIEERGTMGDADPRTISKRAKQREYQQVGTLGSGNHYLEVQYVDEIYDPETAEAYGLFPNQVVVSIHCGSRGLGHQIGTDYLKTLGAASKKYGIPIRDKELVCAPIGSPEGKQYLSAMNCGINVAFANRQAIAHLTRGAFERILGVSPREIETLYEVGHNNAKIEEHQVNGQVKRILVHRKGATRAFGPGREEVSERYRAFGQPVLVGGTMGTCSYILRGTEKGMRDVFGSAIHGAGRMMSRNQAKRSYRGDQIVRQLAERGIIIKDHGKAGVAEEAPQAYKDITEVVDIMDRAGVNRKVARVRPLICVKG